MRINLKVIYKNYLNIISCLYLLFIFVTLSIGRTFSIMHTNIFTIPVFITELFLLVSLPFLMLHYRVLFKLPGLFCIPFALFIVLGLYYLFIGIFNHNLFALRDIVLCVYCLFFVLTYLILNKTELFKVFLIVLLVSNLVNLFIGRLILLNNYSFAGMGIMVENVKSTHFGLYYGFVLAFLFAFFPRISKLKHKILFFLLMAANVYMLIFSTKRALWLALFFLVIFFIFIYRLAFIRLFLKILPFIIILCALLFRMDFKSESRVTKVEYFKSRLNIARNIQLNDTLSSTSGLAPSSVSPPLLAEKEGQRNIQLNDAPSSTSGLAPSSASPPSLAEKESIKNITWRFDVWMQSISFGLKSPLFGRGFGVYPNYVVYSGPLALPSRFDINSGVVPTHNSIVTIFFKMGFVGLILFLFVNSYVFLYGLKYIQKTNDKFLRCFLIGSLGSFVFWHVMALFFDIIDSPPTSIFLWIFIGMIFAIIKLIKIDLRDSKFVRHE